MNKRKIKKITICSSASFYRQVWAIKEKLECNGFKVWVPHTASLMNHSGNYKVSDYKTWYKNPEDYKRKAWLMKKHFDEVHKAQAILVVNLKKKGLSGYIFYLESGAEELTIL